MADISDICQYLASAVTTIVYPSGTGSPSIAGVDTRIYEGWPNADQLDLDVAGKALVGYPPVLGPRTGGPVVNVSIFPMQGSTATPYQIYDKTYVIVPPVYGLTVTSDGLGTVGITGTPTAGEYVTIIANRKKTYSRTAASAAAIVTALTADIIVDFPSVTNPLSTSINIPNLYQFDVRQGAKATLGKVTWRQKQAVMVTVWAPTHVLRSTLGAAIDAGLKVNLKITLPDTSEAIVRYSRSNQTDEESVETIYRRDLIYEVEYATLQQFPGFVITSVDVTVANFNTSLIAHAIK